MTSGQFEHGLCRERPASSTGPRQTSWTGMPTSTRLGPEPPAPEATVFEAVAERQSAKAATARAEAAIAKAEAAAGEERILQAMREYDRPDEQTGHVSRRVSSWGCAARPSASCGTGATNERHARHTDHRRRSKRGVGHRRRFRCFARHNTATEIKSSATCFSRTEET